MKENNILRWRYLLSTALIVIVLDRISKLIAVTKMAEAQSIKVLPGIFHMTLVFNKGAAFGLMKDRGVFFIALSAFVIFFILAYTWKTKVSSAKFFFSLGLILGGAVGNLIDRVKFGYVVDFFDFRIWPVFNIADSSITIGAFILAWMILVRKSVT